MALPQVAFVYLPSLGRGHRFQVVAGRALLLTTTGRKSAEPRTCALIYVRDGERLVVVASNGGSDRPPFWLLNLQAHPDVMVQIGRKKFPARASVASAEDRQRLWPLVNRHNRGLAPIMHPGARGRYDAYQRHTTRPIPRCAARTHNRDTRLELSRLGSSPASSRRRGVGDGGSLSGCS